MRGGHRLKRRPPNSSGGLSSALKVRRVPLALAGQRARSFSSNFLFAGEASKNYGGHEEAKSHNACAKNDNEECNQGCNKESHSQILISFTRAKKICSGIMSEARSAER
jgi:hypothetical protein